MKVFFGHFSKKPGRIKRSQVMSMVKFSLIVFNFGYDFVPLVHFLGHPVAGKSASNSGNARKKPFSQENVP